MAVHAEYKCLPMYEYIRPGIYVLFNQNGDYRTDDPKVITALNSAAPFIKCTNALQPEVVSVDSVVIVDVPIAVKPPARSKK